MNSFDLLFPTHWKDYALLDSGEGERLERFGNYTIRRPDPQVLWERVLPATQWENVEAHFVRTVKDKGEWKFSKKIPEGWELSYQNLKFWVEPTPFKHLGIFPEQAAHWEWMQKKIIASKRADVKVLNLFGYTGLASLACAAAGAQVTHVDASRPAIGWARKNQEMSGLSEKPIRWILEDVLSFVKREVRRGNTYDAILMDPPAYGHGADGEVWQFHDSLPDLLSECKKLLAPRPLFVIINAYAVSVSSMLLYNLLLDMTVSLEGTASCGELALKQESGERVLSTGIFGRWEGKE